MNKFRYLTGLTRTGAAIEHVANEAFRFVTSCCDCFVVILVLIPANVAELDLVQILLLEFVLLSLMGAVKLVALDYEFTLNY